jgi:hypothetical protein
MAKAASLSLTSAGSTSPVGDYTPSVEKHPPLEIHAWVSVEFPKEFQKIK